FLLVRHSLIPKLFPYTTLFRSVQLWTDVVQHHTSKRNGMARVQAKFAAIRTQGRRGSKTCSHCHAYQTAHGRTDPIQPRRVETRDRKSTRLNSSHVKISYAVFC